MLHLHQQHQAQVMPMLNSAHAYGKRKDSLPSPMYIPCNTTCMPSASQPTKHMCSMCAFVWNPSCRLVMAALGKGDAVDDINLGDDVIVLQKSAGTYALVSDTEHPLQHSPFLFMWQTDQPPQPPTATVHCNPNIHTNMADDNLLPLERQLCSLPGVMVDPPSYPLPCQ